MRTFLTQNTDANVCCLYHVDVIGSITYCKSCLVLTVFLDQADDSGLLLWRGSVYYKALGLQEGIYKLLAQEFISLCFNRIDKYFNR